MTVEKILAKLISFPILGGEANLEIANWIKAYIESFHIEVQEVVSEKKDKKALHCRIGPAIDGGIILSGHTDVVPVKDQAWLTDPFVLIDKGDGKLYGRGTCDMKGFLACCLAMIPNMVNTKLKKPIYFAFSFDEEIGCLSGVQLAKAIANSYKEKPRHAIIGEPTLLQPIVGQKGICVLKTCVTGSAGHSSRIKTEVSAVHEAARLILWLENKMNQLIEEQRLDDRFEPPHSSIHIGMVDGGIAPNIIASKASFFWDLRTIPMDNVKEIVDEFNLHCKKRETKLKQIFPDFSIATEENHPPVPCLDTDKDAAVVRLVQKITGQKKIKTVAYASEAGQFANEGFEAVICGPGDISQAHRANEYITKEQLYKGVEMIENLLEEFSN